MLIYTKSDTSIYINTVYKHGQTLTIAHTHRDTIRYIQTEKKLINKNLNEIPKHAQTNT